MRKLSAQLLKVFLVSWPISGMWPFLFIGALKILVKFGFVRSHFTDSERSLVDSLFTHSLLILFVSIVFSSIFAFSIDPRSETIQWFGYIGATGVVLTFIFNLYVVLYKGCRHV